ncbi:unknown [Clostridium sp. CAG:1193]|nr:unknown [Clostridium sp. CAG:1193]
MKNKEMLSHVIDKYFDKDNNYNLIIKKIDNKNYVRKKYIHIFSYACAFLITITMLVFSSLNKTNSSYTEFNNEKIVFNKIDIIKNNRDNDIYDALYDGNKILENKKVIKKGDISVLNNYSFYKNIGNLNDFDIEMYEIYVDNKLNSYNLKYTKDKKIVDIIFSKNVIYEENSENINSYINNTKVYMYQDNDSYLAIFNYNGINFVLESNIEKEEFIKILKSIIR